MSRCPWTVVIVAALVLGGCGNTYVQEILRAPTSLSGITIECLYHQQGTEEGVYTAVEASPNLSPLFTSDRWEYTFVAPDESERVRFNLSLGKEARVVSVVKTPLEPERGQEEPIENAALNAGEDGSVSVVFELPAFEQKCAITAHVERDYMISVDYTVTIYRQQPNWIEDIYVTTARTGTAKFYPEPVFDSSITDYSFAVSTESEDFTLHLTKRELYETSDFGNEENAAERAQELNIIDWESISVGITVSPAAIGTGTLTSEGAFVLFYQPFPGTEKEAEVVITVTHATEGKSPVVYHLEIYRPFPVTHLLTEGHEAGEVVISGSTKDSEGRYTFKPADAVSFTVNPPFGHYTTSLAITCSGAALTLYSAEAPSETSWLRTPTTYIFVMPKGDVVIETGPWTPIPAVSAFTVRYVRSGGTGDGSSWKEASGNLQRMMDEPGDYDEIWVAEGTLGVPEWSEWKDEEAPEWFSPAGEGTITSWEAFTDEGSYRHWAYILRDGAKIYGGFNGSEYSAEDRDGRDASANPSAIEAVSSHGDTIRTIIAAEVGPETLLDGLVVTGSRLITESELKGLYAYYVTHTAFMRLTVNGDRLKDHYGRAIYITGSGPVLRAVTVQNAISAGSPSVFIENRSHPVLINCVVATGQGGFGGSAISVEDASSGVVMIGGSIERNYDAGVAAVDILNGGNGVFVNVKMRNNLTSPVYVQADSEAVFINCSITKNVERITEINGTNNEFLEINDKNEASSLGLLTRGSFYNCYIAGNRPGNGNPFCTFNSVSGDCNFTPVSFGTAASDTIMEGDADHYPLTESGEWRETYPGKELLENDKWLTEDVKERIQEVLAQGAASLGLSVDTITLGAPE